MFHELQGLQLDLVKFIRRWEVFWQHEFRGMPRGDRDDDELWNAMKKCNLNFLIKVLKNINNGNAVGNDASVSLKDVMAKVVSSFVALTVWIMT